jgi:4-amino-4-deoxy-L-arabinose transferase-like glycosyltransferase
MKKPSKKVKIETILLFLILGLAIFLRFQKIQKLHYFTYDQARDNLVVARILKNQKWTLLGPQSSIGGVYSPPAYYYTLALPLWLARLNPVGADIYTALVGVLTVFLLFYVAKKLFGPPAGLFAASLYATSPIVVELARRAWNPNTLPFFSLLTLFSAFKFLKTNQTRWLLFASLAFGYSLSLHYSAFCLLPVFIFLWIRTYLKNKNWKLILASVILIGLFFLPLLLFEFRHGFLLTKSFKDYFFQKGGYYLGPARPSFFESSLASLYEIIVAPLSGYFLKGAPGSSAPYQFAGRVKDVLFQFSAVSIIAHKPLIIKYAWWGRVLFFVLVLFSLWQVFSKRQKNQPLIFLWLIFLSAVVVSRLYRGKIYFFYYLFLYPIPFLLFGALLKWFYRSGTWQKILTLLVVLGLTGSAFQQSLAYETTDRTLEDIRDVARLISLDVDQQSFNLAASYKDPDRWDHHALDFRYFVEAYFDKKPLDWYPENYRQAKILYLISETRIERPTQHLFMEIAEFNPRQLLAFWNYQDKIFIYKLGK